MSLITPLLAYARIRDLLPMLLHPHGASTLSSLNPQPPPAAVPAHRLRAATWMNGRTALGAGFVLLAVLAGALFLDRAQRLVPVYAAAGDLPAGTPLRSGDLMVVRSQLVPRRLSTDISTSFGWYTSLAHQGFKPAGETRVTQERCPADAAEWLGIEEGTTVTVRDRLMGGEGEPPAMLATSYFPARVVERAPDLADASKGGMPELLRAAWGETFSEDVLTVRMATFQEQQRLELDKGTPVQVIAGATFDQQHRPLHFIRVVAAGGRIEFAYRYGTVPNLP